MNTVASPSILVLLGCALGCGDAPTRSQQWFAERGRNSPTWHTCARLGAEMRDTCGTDAACATEVTRELTRYCYAGRYGDKANHVPSHDELRAERLSPCFWDVEPKKAASPVDYAQRTCRTAVDAKLQTACVAELREVIEGICTEGAMDLTGAGP